MRLSAAIKKPPQKAAAGLEARRDKTKTRGDLRCCLCF